MIKEIPDHFGYSVSDEGEVFDKHGRKLPQRLHPFGYPMVSLWDRENKRRVTRTVHSLVMLTFVGERKRGLLVRHLDGNPKNCKLSNLSYGTQKQNMLDAIRHGTVERGEARYNSKLTKEAVLEIRRRSAQGEKSCVLSAEFGVAESKISKVISGKSWAHVVGEPIRARSHNVLDKDGQAKVIEDLKSGLSLKKTAAKHKISLTQLYRIRSENENKVD